MIELRPQIIHSTSGEELIVLTRAEFDAIVTALADQIEDADDVAMFDARSADLHSGRWLSSR